MSPALLFAQDRRANLIGQWARQDGKDTIAFQADSTYIWKGFPLGKATVDLNGLWRLAGDTVVFTRNIYQRDDSYYGGVSGYTRRIRLNENELAFVSMSAQEPSGLYGRLVVPVDLSPLKPQRGAPSQPERARLTVQPHEMATGTRNPAVGEYQLDSVPNYLVSVPAQCVGARRCPLFIFLPGGGYGARQVTDWLRPVADKYGMILLAPTRDSPRSSLAAEINRRHLDVALRQLLRQFAIDPAKIAIIGRCASGGDGMRLGIDNPQIFSRIASISGGVWKTGLGPENKAAEFFVDAGYGEYVENFNAVQAMRQAGYQVKHVVGIRGHEHQVEDYDFLGRWLQESWTTPNPAARSVPSVVADPLPVLTPQVIAKMTAFWGRFQQEPDSIRTVARRAHLREVVMPVGEDRPTVVMTDMPALAAKYPSVAVALKAAGLTAEQHEAYRIALLSAQTARHRWDGISIADRAVEADRVVKFGRDEPWPVDSTSVQGKNLELVTTERPGELRALWDTGIWRTP